MNALVYAVKLIIMDDPQDSINVSSTEPDNGGTESVEALWARSKNQPSKYESDSESDSGFLKYSPMTIAVSQGRFACLSDSSKTMQADLGGRLLIFSGSHLKDRRKSWVERRSGRDQDQDSRGPNCHSEELAGYLSKGDQR